jgi:hypothetical protein
MVTWAGVEINLSVVCATMPSLPILFRVLRKRINGESIKSGSGSVGAPSSGGHYPGSSMSREELRSSRVGMASQGYTEIPGKWGVKRSKRTGTVSVIGVGDKGEDMGMRVEQQGQPGSREKLDPRHIQMVTVTTVTTSDSVSLGGSESETYLPIHKPSSVARPNGTGRRDMWK